MNSTKAVAEDELVTPSGEHGSAEPDPLGSADPLASCLLSLPPFAEICYSPSYVAEAPELCPKLAYAM